MRSSVGWVSHDRPRTVREQRPPVDTDGLARWFSDQLSEAYGAGLRDGYVQGRHDRHKDGEAT
jgi:hypothetical protein